MVSLQVQAIPLRLMSRRIDIELTSSLGDGTWTWRAAGARQPKGVLDGSILPEGAKVGDELKVEAEQEIDGITILQVVHGREKQERSLLELLPAEREFQPVVETRARRERGERPRRDGDRPRRDGDRPRRDGDRPRRDGDRPRRDDRGAGGGGDRPRRDDRGGGGGGGDARRDGGRDRNRGERRGPSFTPPPEVPQRPKPKRLRPGKQHRNAVLAELPAEQRQIAELALQGMGAVRQRLREENDKAAAEGRAVMPEASVLKLAEDLLPKLRVAEWRDRAEAAKAQADELDLRDLRSVVAASEDPMVARDDTTRSLADELKVLLVHKQEQELSMWFADIDAALAVGRVIRALRLSSQPPKAGVPFPTDIAQRLADSTNASLAPMDAPDRWAAMLEAAAFSPIRSLVKPTLKPHVMSDELTATITRLAPALPHVAELFGIEVDPKAPMPKPLRPAPRPGKGKPEGSKGEPGDRGKRPDRGPKPRTGTPRGGEAAANAETPPAQPAPAATSPDAPVSESAAVAADEAPADAATETAATDEAPADVSDQAATDEAPADAATETAATDEAPADVSDQAATDEAPADAATETAATDEAPADVSHQAATDEAPADVSHQAATDEAPADVSDHAATDEAPADAATQTAATDEAPADVSDQAATDEAPADAATETAATDEAPADVSDQAAADEAPADAATETAATDEAPADVSDHAAADEAPADVSDHAAADEAPADVSDHAAADEATTEAGSDQPA
jgi:hypothetical protein